MEADRRKNERPLRKVNLIDQFSGVVGIPILICNGPEVNLLYIFTKIIP